MLGYQGIEPLERDYECDFCWSTCGLVGGCVSLKVGFEVLKAQARPSVSLFLLSADLNVELLATLQDYVCVLSYFLL